MKSNGDLSLAGPIGQYRKNGFGEPVLLGRYHGDSQSFLRFIQIHRQFIASRYSNG